MSAVSLVSHMKLNWLHWQLFIFKIRGSLIYPLDIEKMQPACNGRETKLVEPCCVFWPANACLHMHSHGRKWYKTFKNHVKSTFFIMLTRGSCKAHGEKWRKKFVGQRLGVTLKSWLTPKRWLLIWNFVVFCSNHYLLTYLYISILHQEDRIVSMSLSIIHIQR